MWTVEGVLVLDTILWSVHAARPFLKGANHNRGTESVGAESSIPGEVIALQRLLSHCLEAARSVPPIL